MKKFLLPLIVLVLLASLGALAWFTLRGESNETTRPLAQNGPAVPDSPMQAPADLPAAAAAPEGPSEVVREEAKTAAQELRDERFAPANLVELRGLVQLPPRTPANERIKVWALESESNPSARLLDMDFDRPDSSARAIAVLAQSDLNPTGTFMLKIPKDAPKVWLYARGLFVAAREAKQVESGQTDIALETELGAWLHGKLVAAGADDPKDYQDWKVRLVSQPAGGSFDTMGPGGPRFARRDRALSAQGTFEFFAVRPGTSLELQGVPEHWAAFKSEKFELEPGAERSMEIVLTRGGSISGRVVDELGQGVVGAKLEAELGSVMFGRGGLEVRQTKSDALGNFELAAVAPGKLSLHVDKKGFLEQRVPVELTQGEQRKGLAITLGSGGLLAGRVLWPDGTPAADVDVDVDFDQASLGGLDGLNALQGNSGSADTDEQGRFRVSGLGKGPFVVEVRARPKGAEQAARTSTLDSWPKGQDEPLAAPGATDSTSQVRWTARLAGLRPPREDLELRLEAPLSIAGRVQDSAGNGLDSFRVVARSKVGGAGIAGMGGERLEQQFDGTKGTFTLDGFSTGKWEVAALAEGYSPPAAALDIVLPLDPAAAPLTITLEKAASVAGTVLDPTGKPVAGATVAPRIDLTQLGKLATQGQPPRAESGADGTFALSNLGIGGHNLVASLEGYARSPAVAVDLAPGEAEAGVVLSLRIGGTIRGEIFGKDGKLAAGRMIVAQVPEDMTGQKIATSDAEGRFVFAHVEAGNWQVVALGGGSSSKAPGGDDPGAAVSDMLGDMKFSVAKVVDGEEVFVQLGAPPADPVRLSGRVVLAGSGQEGLMVAFVADGRKMGEAMKFTTTAKGGNFEMDLPGPGSYLVTAQKLTGGMGQQQSYETRVDIPKVSEHSLEIDLPLGRIAGSVRGPDGPKAGARVNLWNDGPISNGSLSGGNFAEIQTDAKGNFEIGWLRPGEYVVAAGGAPMLNLGGDDAGTLGRELRTGLKIGEGQSLEGLDFRLKASGSIEGTLVGAGGAALGGATVFARDENGAIVDRISFVQSDPGGRFRYSGLAPGQYKVWARDASQVSQEVVVKVAEANTSEVNLVMAAGTVLVVSLSDAKDAPLDCKVSVLDSSGKLVNGVFSMTEIMSSLQQGNWSSKEQRVGPLPPGKYKVMAATSDGQVASKPVQLSGQQSERKVSLRVGEG